MATSVKAVPTSLRIRVAPEEVVVRFWGLRDEPLGTWLRVILGAAGSAAVGSFLEHEGWGWGTLVLVLITLWRSLIPLRFELGPYGVTQFVLGRRMRIPWTAILNYQILSRGLLLLPDAAVTPLSPLRGLFLPWGSQQERVLANIEYYLASWTASQSTTSR
jgi:hypothetical protein